MPTYKIPIRNSRSTPSLLLHLLNSLVIPVARIIGKLFGLFVVTAFLPLVAIAYTVFVGLIMVIVGFPQMVYTKVTGRRVDWMERLFPFGRTSKMTPTQMKKRKLFNDD